MTRWLGARRESRQRNWTTTTTATSVIPSIAATSENERPGEATEIPTKDPAAALLTGTATSSPTKREECDM